MILAVLVLAVIVLADRALAQHYRIRALERELLALEGRFAGLAGELTDLLEQIAQDVLGDVSMGGHAQATPAAPVEGEARPEAPTA